MDITELITSTMAVIAVCLLTLVIRPMKQDAKLKNFMTLVSMGISAAEQMAKTETVKNKKYYVQEFLKAQGIKYNEDLINAAIESEVRKLKEGAAVE